MRVKVLQPCRDRRGLRLSVEKSGGEHKGRFRSRRLAVNPRSVRVDVRNFGFDRRNVARFHQIRFRQHDRVRHRHLPAAFGLRREMVAAKERVDRYYNRFKPQEARQHRVAQDRLRYWRGISETRGLDDQPRKLRQLASLRAAENAHHRLFEIARKVATEAPVRHNNGLVITMTDQMLVERRFAKFVDGDGCVGQTRIAQQCVQESRLAAAEKSGQ